MKKFAFVLYVALIAAVSGAPAFATGAIAIGAKSNLGAHGVSVGMSGDFGSRSAAKNDALQQCKAGQVSASIRALCKVVGTYSNQCSAVAMDAKAGAPGLGWGVAETSRAASRVAMQRCKATAAGRGWACKVATTSCDGNAR